MSEPRLNPFQAVRLSLTRTFDFRGRSRRSEYWWTMLVFVAIGLPLVLLDEFLFAGQWESQNSHGWAGFVGYLRYYPISSIFEWLTLIPLVSLGMRRLHDIGRTGWWALIGLIPILGLIVLIIFAATEGNRGRNEYGSDPKETDEAYA